MLATYVTEAADGETRLTRQFSGEGHGAFRIAEPLIAWLARRTRAEEITNIKRILEAGPDVAGAS
jgi:hypothetical protein